MALVLFLVPGYNDCGHGADRRCRLRAASLIVQRCFSPRKVRCTRHQGTVLASKHPANSDHTTAGVHSAQSNSAAPTRQRKIFQTCAQSYQLRFPGNVAAVSLKSPLVGWRDGAGKSKLVALP